MKRYLYIFTYLLSLAMVLGACKTKTESGMSSTSFKVAQVTAFRLKNDSVAGLNNVVFNVFSSYVAAESYVQLQEDSAKVGLIMNIDSMTYGTVLDSVKPEFNYYSTPSRATLSIRHYYDRSIPDTIVSLTGTDTLNMSADSIYLDIVSNDGTAYKRYRIIPRVHQVNPYLYTWKKVTDNLYAKNYEAEQKLLCIDDELYLYTNDGMGTYLSTAQLSIENRLPKAVTFGEKQAVSSLPANCKVKQIITKTSESGTNFYYAEPGTNSYYYSEDGMSWTEANSADYTFLATLFVFPDATGEKAWFAATDNNGQDALVCLEDDNSTFTMFQSFAKNRLPVSGFSVVRFASASNRDRLMVLGGFAEDGTMLNSRYNIEYSQVIGEPRLTDFSVEELDFPKLINSAVVSYNNQLMLFGAQDESYEYLGRDIYCSKDEGILWNQADTAHCILPEDYTERKNVSALVHRGNIYLFGGSDNTSYYSDLYVGRLQSIDW